MTLTRPMRAAQSVPNPEACLRPPAGRAGKQASGPDAASQRIIVALDVPTKAEALRLVRQLSGGVGMFKVGSPLFTAAGPSFVRALVELGERVFLDLKFHDIPHVVAAACVQAAALGVSLVDVHAAGGPQMLRAARQALDRHVPAGRRPRLLAVTLLTSLAQRELKAIGWKGTVQQNVIRLARLAQRAGCDGVVAAPTDVAAIRCVPKLRDKDFLIVTPGIRLPGRKKLAGQARVATPAAALRAGADYIVIGRALTQARNPLHILHRLTEHLSQALP
ncbi:MAG: orotidine-5'-phosphate decarboxylase [Terriglobia bacterium]